MILKDTGEWKLRGIGANSCAQKSRAPAWEQGPRKARLIAGVVVTPARGVIHPSFPLRGRCDSISTICNKLQKLLN